MTDPEKEREFVNRVMRLTINQKPEKCNFVVNFFYRLCDMTDIAEHILRAGQANLPYYVCVISLRIFLELQANLLQGAYHSAARSLRWLYETNIAGATACISPYLLDGGYEDKSELSTEEFEEWLDLYDRQEVRLMRKRILEAFDLPTEEIDNLYSVLCKYIHVSKLSFDKDLDFPKLQYISEKFDEMFGLMIKTMDVVLWMQSRMLLRYENGTAEALKWFLKDWGSINKYIPLTESLISNLQ